MVVFMVTILLIGNLIVETEAFDRHQRQQYLRCFAGCNRICLASPWVRNKLECPGKCALLCAVNKKSDEINQIDDFCQVGCVTLNCDSVEDQSKFFETIIHFNLHIK